MPSYCDHNRVVPKCWECHAHRARQCELLIVEKDKRITILESQLDAYRRIEGDSEALLELTDKAEERAREYPETETEEETES